jgi:hypothetical protein
VSEWTPFSFSFNWGNRERWNGWGMTVMFVFGQKIPGGKGSGDGVLSWFSSQFFCCHSSGQSLHTFSRSGRMTSQWYVELTVRPARNNLFDVKENDEHVLDFALHESHWRVWTFPLGRLLLSLRVITINPALITSDNSGQEGCIVRGNVMKFSLKLTCCCFWSAVRNHIRPDTRLQIKRR